MRTSFRTSVESRSSKIASPFITSGVSRGGGDSRGATLPDPAAAIDGEVEGTARCFSGRRPLEPASGEPSAVAMTRAIAARMRVASVFGELRAGATLVPPRQRRSKQGVIRDIGGARGGVRAKIGSCSSRTTVRKENRQGRE